MNIIILGANPVVSGLAENLVLEDNNVTIIGEDADFLADLQNRIDIRTVHGKGCYPHLLHKADADNADLIIAVTNNDEVNLVACQVAYALFDVTTKIARMRSQRYSTRQELFESGGFAVDVIINPERLVTHYIQRLIEHPGALQVLDFADGQLQLVSVKPDFGGALVGKRLADIPELLPEAEFRVTALFRNDEMLELYGETTIEQGDEIFLLADRHHIAKIIPALGQRHQPYKKIMIAGGGKIGFRLAQALESHYNVKIIEQVPERTLQLAEELDNTTILLGNAADKELMIEENIEHTDLFCALTNDDEDNIMSAMLAKRLGARQAMALVTRSGYVDLIEDGSQIDIAISPQVATVSGILTHIRQGDVVRVHALRRGAAEAIEVIAHGDQKTSKVVGRAIETINLPPDSSIGAIVRDGRVILAHHDTVVEADDHVVLFINNKKYIHDIEKLFQVSATYL